VENLVLITDIHSEESIQEHKQILDSKTCGTCVHTSPNQG